MVVPFNPAYRPTGRRAESMPVLRVKAKATTLGATRAGLVQVLRHLGIYQERIAARLRAGREIDRAIEVERLFRAGVEREAARRHEEARVARLREEEQFARLAEERRADRLLREEKVYQSLSEEERAAWHQEEEIAGWLKMPDEDGA